MNNRLLKSTPLMIGTVLLSLAGIGGILSQIPFAMKEDLTEYKIYVDKKFAEQKDEMKTLWTLKNQDNKWYIELSQEFGKDMAAVKSDVKHIQTDIKDIKRHLLNDH